MTKYLCTEQNIVDRFSVPDVITSEFASSCEPFSIAGIWQLCYRDLRDTAFVDMNKERLSELKFNTQTTFPENISETTRKILEDGKSNHLNAEKLYETGHYGDNVKVALIDRPININHLELKNKIQYTNVIPDHEGNYKYDFHGMTCVSFLCGNSCGVAPKVDLHYYAIPSRKNNIDEYYDWQLQALQMVVDYNKVNADPIRIVSLSAPFNEKQMTVRDKLAAELKQQHCYLLDAKVYNRCFAGIDCYPDLSGETVYSLNRWQIENFERNKHREGFEEFFYHKCVYVPSSRRTSASNYNDNAFIYWGKDVSASWTIPQIAGAFALLMQIKPDLSFGEFLEIARNCSRDQNGLIIFNVEQMYNNLKERL